MMMAPIAFPMEIFSLREHQLRPEIFVMGDRNPTEFQLTKTGYLYWGEVGPDAGKIVLIPVVHADTMK